MRILSGLWHSIVKVAAAARYRNHRMIVGVWAAERDSFDVIRIVTAPDKFQGGGWQNSSWLQSK